MNFDLTEDQQMLADSARQFARKESPLTRLRQLRKDATGWDKKMWKKMAEQGWAGILYPERLGGYGGTFVDAMVVFENLATTLTPEPLLASAVLGGLPILFAGTEKQQDALLKPMISGDTTLAFAYAERNTRHALEQTAAMAKREGNDYVLSGEKVWVLNGHAADVIVVLARTSGKPGDRAGLSLFAVDAKSAGMQSKIASGIDSERYGLLTLSNVKVPADRLIGAEGKAFDVAERVLDYAAAAACCQGVGMLQEMLTMTVGYLNTRKQFNVLIGTFQSLQHRAVDMFVETELCKGTAILAAIKVDSADADERRASVSAAKVNLSLGGRYVSQQAIQLHGGIGVTDEHDIGLYFKRMHVINTLFGDEAFHTGRYASAASFEARA